MKLQPLVMHPNDHRPSLVGAEVYCENGHYAFTIGAFDSDGWPRLLNAAGDDVSGQYIGRPIPFMCECGALVARFAKDGELPHGPLMRWPDT